MLKLTLYKKSDFKAFKKYIAAAFHKKYILGDQRYFNWQYKNSLYLLKANSPDRSGEIVGHFGFRDLQYKIGKRTKKVRVLINLFVLEKFRAFGFGAMLIKKVLGKKNPCLVAGYRLPAMKAFKHYKENWQEGILNRYLAFPREIGWEESIKIKSLKVIQRPEEINRWWGRARQMFSATIERNYDYLAWRFLKNPFLRYQILGAKQNGKLGGILIWRQDGEGRYKMGRIVDFVADKKSAAPLLLAFLAELKKKRISLGEFLFSGDFYKKELKAAGFFNAVGTKFESYPVLLNPVSFKRHNINIAYTFGIDFENCYFTKAEGDQDRANPH
ncbi:MAG: hypothetical protein A3J53_01855 [Candidatus Harrisonbacteria bacterium RIFCSPHIGHO2_02_FULL_40_20]|nr:MAG: hypothetical protein A3J53_01855 [Candidatus Harrisonbacteria bacterium RIFCSPHIGHO2_02_FULL_40_20]